jgi:hypothetical protein
MHPGGGIAMVPVYSSGGVSLQAVHEADLSAPIIQGNSASFTFQTTAGVSNVVQYTVSLSPANWRNLTNFLGDGTVHTVTDPSATNSTRFYRVIIE